MHDSIYDPTDSTGPRKSRFWALRDSGRIRSQPWRWPLGSLGDREPIVLAEHLDGDRRGVDLGYEARPYDAALFVPVYAVQSGDVMYCAETRSGFAITIEHVGTDWLTLYGHLSKVFVATDREHKGRFRQTVRGGDVIGYAAKSPIHVRFELVTRDADRRFVTVDPMAHVTTWTKPPTPVSSRLDTLKEAA